MRLINVKTLKLEEFLDSVPKYAILSHTWGDEAEELTFRDVQDGNINKPGIGRVKLHGCCQQAQKDGLEYAWIDTCCIDKTNSVELSEAINSMFRWYSDADFCYAYLSDVPGDDNAPKEGSKFLTSRWFLRGWTLQELLAPEHVRFYNEDWVIIGTKGNMCATIGKITGVPRHFLLGITDLHTASVAQRMSWAAQRDTKRKEDLAYCLLGIFDEQIMKTTRDDSILAWGLSTDEPFTNEDSDQVIAGRILAAAPSDFANSGQIVPREQASTSLNALDMSGGSLRINTSLFTTSKGNTFGLLNCRPEHDDDHVVGIPLIKVTALSDEFVRPKGCYSVLQPITASNDTPKPIHIKHESDKKISKISMDKERQFWLYEDEQFSEVNLTLIDVEPQSCWDKERALITSTTKSEDGVPHRTLARFRHSEDASWDFVIVLEFEEHGSTIKAECSVMICHRSTDSDEILAKVQYLLQKAARKRSASNGMLNLSVELEPVAQQPIFIIRPKATDDILDITIDATAELEKFDLMLEFTTILQEKVQNDAKEKKLNQAANDKSDRLEQIKKERDVIEEEIRKLEEQRRLLLDDESNLRAQVYHLSDEQAEMREKQQDASERWSQAQKRWAELYGMDIDTSKAEDEVVQTPAPRTPLLWAAENGDIQMAWLLLYQHVDVMVPDKDGRTPLIVAASHGHFEIVRMLLEAMDPDYKDSETGQTPLSWAAANGNATLVQLLLDTGRVHIDSKDRNGWTPLRWATEKKHEAITRILLEHNAAQDAAPRENVKTADYSKAIDSRLLDMLARTSSLGVVRGKANRTVSDSKRPKARTWFNLESKKATTQVVVSEVVEDSSSDIPERRSTS
ncbi:Vegetative incompatibility protein HET-E-1 [Cladobotryum mycophilum]|uniref:Vegetative incompatibility protein HET-E-1 n=1 Tax=Cladobotryum mycophilum TaxID=491253 RepID=A0ABR0SSE9_9HYPO